MSIVMAGLSPHPPIIIPEIGGKEISSVKKTVNSLNSLTQEIVEKKPDVIVSISPHGPVFSDAVSVFEKKKLEGDFSNFGHPELKYEIDIDLNFIDKLQKNAASENIEVMKIDNNIFNSPGLDHGVLVPLYYLKKNGLKDIPFVNLSMGLLSYKELYKFGYFIKKTALDCNKKIIVLASGDLSHRLIPGAPAGYNPRGKKFDELIVKLLKEKKFNELLNIDKNLIDKAGECGLRPIIIMLGSLKNSKVNVDLKSYEGPFGVGYAVAGFYPERR